ncbi:YigZ family protein [Selenomonadales bacterium OttesenSCG-928-I06]|nr:YigZ family protein [Selenomonadales bacterium OttesenSCG-928-I06]
MSNFSYRTLKGYGEAEYIINKSKFIAYAKRIETEEEARLFLAEIKKKHYDATHNCSAYIIKQENSSEINKADDDGEPSGTAGKPILEVLKRNELINSIVVVTRYFGGIKLGGGGLIRAYGKAAGLGISAAKVVVRSLYSKMEIAIDYELLGKLENDLKNKNYIIGEKEFSNNVKVNVFVDKEDEEKFIKEIEAITSAKAKVDKLEEIYLDIEINEFA